MTFEPTRGAEIRRVGRNISPPANLPRRSFLTLRVVVVNAS
jgi:hypothetical protein